MRQVPAELGARLGEVAETFAGRSEELRVADVADATGIPRATLYYYFSGRDDLLGYLVGHLVDRRREAVERALRSPGDERDRLDAVLRAVLRFIGDNPGTHLTLWAHVGSLGSLRNLAERSHVAFHTPVRQLLIDGRQRGLFRRVSNPETTASALYGAITFAGLHYVVANGSLDVDRVADEVIPQLLEGLG